ncbi:unnamed protein product [Mytilus edulis]|uniref:DDE Tnp4 domain-containing protein n=1 Tax=Mytilus edulis TaxID=6550 RepID=A0A8S3RFK8_MYTED|nr:unnamed protein product [Mytilus edulis]
MVSHAKKKRLDFDDPNSLTDEDIVSLTGITKEQFEFLVSSVSKLKKSANRSPITAIAILISGNSFWNRSKRKVSKIVQQAKSALSEDFVPSYIGFHHISRDEIIENHTTNFATQLFSNFLSDSVITIMDGTYIYIQKSNKFKFQRRCFSMHKHRPLLKPMVVTSTDGYILSILGPYLADGKNNDASIVQHMMRSNDENMMKWFKKDDILILDRGFRDALEFLHACGFQTESPAFLAKSAKQFSTEDANLSRLVTKIRWTVESVNARIKTWKYFDKVVPNIDILNLKEYLRIVGAICNKFKPPLITSVEEHCDIARSMLEKSKQPNLLQERVLKDKALGKRSREWVPLHDCKHYDNFPKLTVDYLRSLTFGVYQLYQAPNYADQHLDNDGDIDIFLHTVSSSIVQAKIQSRHTSCKQYCLWLITYHYLKPDSIQTNLYCLPPMKSSGLIISP